MGFLAFIIIKIIIIIINQSVENGEKVVCIPFELLKIVHFLFSMSVVYRPHPLY